MNLLETSGIRMQTSLEPKLDPRAKAKDIADQFEALFMQSMVEGMRKTADMGVGESMFGDGPGADTYSQWFDNFMSVHLSDNGNIGLSETLMREFERTGQIPSEEDAEKQAEDS